MIEDLWGELPKGEKQPTPAAILKEQADLLSKKTDDQLIGKMLTLKHDKEFSFRLRIEVPSLTGVSVDLFTISYPIGLYPVSLLSEVENVPKSTSNDKEEFIINLSNFLKAEPVQILIKRLLTQVRSVE